MLLHDENQSPIHQFILIFLTGVKAPTCRKDIATTVDIIEPFGEESKFFVETRLLQKNAKVSIEGCSNTGFLCSVSVDGVDVGKRLVAEGYAKVQEWTCPLLPNGSLELRDAENRAKKNKTRLWKEYAEKKPGMTSLSNHYDAIVVKIVSPDVLLVEECTTKETRRINLSSVRIPKAKEPKEAFLNFEGRELVRKMLIGKKVSVSMEFTRPALDGYDARDYGTVRIGDYNVAQELVRNGLASVVRHKKDDDRSSAYDSLVTSEEEARIKKRGIHSTEEPLQLRITDYSETATKAKQFLPFLMRTGALLGVIEHCTIGGRYKMYIPSQNCKLTLVLSGVRMPKVEKYENGGSVNESSLAFISRHILQRDVEVVIESSDKVGGFIGSLYLLSSSSQLVSASKVVGMGNAIVDERNVAVMLLEEGFTLTHAGSVQYCKSSREMLEAEEKAKSSKKGIWGIVDPTQLTEKQVSTKVTINTPLTNDVREVIVSDIFDGKLSVQIISKGTVYTCQGLSSILRS